MNNFVFSQDPLLCTTLANRQNMQSEFDVKKQLEEMLIQYQTLSQQQQQQEMQPVHNKQQTRDYLGEIDDMMRDLDEDVALTLNGDAEYLKINDDLQKMIQEEMMRSVKIKINSNPDAITKMERLKSLISTAKKQKSDEERKILADMNDYVKNYSDLTFEEYKQLKYGNK